MNDQALYHRLGQLLTAAPVFVTPRFMASRSLDDDALEWLGMVQAIVNAVGDVVLTVEFNMAASMFIEHAAFSGATQREQKLKFLAIRAFRTLELRVPVTSAGAFIPAGNAFDAMIEVGKVLQSATQGIMIVDPYMDETVLTDFAGQAKELVVLRLLSDAKSRKATVTLKPAVMRWISQHGATRPLQARLSAPRLLHDRLILIDGREAYVLTQSLKDLAARSPASLVRAGEDVAKLKVDAYEDLWRSAEAL